MEPIVNPINPTEIDPKQPITEVKAKPLARNGKPFKTLSSSRVAVRRRAKKVAKLVVQHAWPVSRAMQAVGYSPATSGGGQAIMTHNPIFQAEKTRLMAVLDAQDAKLMDKIALTMRKGLKAKKLVKVEVKELNGMKTQKEIERPDMTERRKHAELLAKAMGQLQEPEKGASGAINFNLLLQMTQAAEKERGLK